MIELKNIEKKFGDRVILKGLNDYFEDKGLFAIVGASGSGKTTLLNIIGLLDRKFDGDIIMNNKDVKHLSHRDKSKFIRQNISYLFQNYALVDNETIVYNLLLALEYSKLSKQEKIEKIKSALNQVNLQFPLDQKVYTLSGGEQQRLSLARTILKPSTIVLADEPTGNLDAENRDYIMKILKKLAKDHCVILVTHEGEVAKMCDRMIQL